MPDEILLPDAIINKLQELADGLYYISESDYPLEVIQLKTDEAECPSDEAIINLAGKSAASVEKDNLNHFFRNMVQEEMVGEEEANRFRELVNFLEQHLQDINVYKVGETEIQAFVLGKLAPGAFAGLKTTVVQT
ncbi:nuclease A inhibitor family protein [Adhaeribacter aquaticus]|uniref:nuclease A inhibitor family protein n=1 Tax=Adhaeribacter aquaticus TaxID=299567 RepID=UPI00040A8F98|nr:nuclease A inhibitor family protein [Adhaeribacter aquaticus]